MNEVHRREPTDSPREENTSSLPGSNRPSGCSPIVIRNFFSVDHFGSTTKYYFLTNPLLACTEPFLNQKWNAPIYCSNETADLLPLVTRHVKSTGIRQEVIRPLKLGKRTPVEPNFYVTAIKSNFCAGSVMFLFEGASVPSSSILCTGPFRADQEFFVGLDASPEGKLLQNTNIGQLYLDNTHLDHELPPKKDTGEMLARLACDNPEVNFLIPLEAVGHEEVLQALADTTGENIVAYKKRFLSHSILRKCPGSTLGDFCEPLEQDMTRRVRGLSVVKRNKRFEAMDASEPFLVVDLYSKPLINRSDNCFHHLAHPSHSSRSELKAFLSRLAFGQLIPTVTPLPVETLRSLEALSRPSASISPCCKQESRIPTVEWEEDLVTVDPTDSPVNAGELTKAHMGVDEESPQETAEDGGDHAADANPARLISPEVPIVDTGNDPVPMDPEGHAMETDELNEALLEVHEEIQGEEENDDGSHLERQHRVVATLLKPKKYEFRLGNIDLSSMAPPIRLGGPPVPKSFSIVVKGNL